MRVLCIAAYVPGPYAAWRLRELGARVTRIEPPQGDPLQTFAPAWYASLREGQEVLRLDLKHESERLQELLAQSDLLLTSIRRSSLTRLSLAWPELHVRHPRCCHVAMVGFAGADADHPGHDVTYQATAGTLDPPHMPRTFLADLAGAERAVSASLALLLERERSGTSGFAEISLAEAANVFAEPVRAGMTTPDGPFGGARPGYRLYETADGWLAVGASEPHFFEPLRRELGDALEEAFRTKSAAEWEAWGKERGLPLARVT